MLVRANLTVWSAAYQREKQGLSCVVSCGVESGVEKLLTPCKCCVIPDVAGKTFTFSDVLRPPASKPEMEELLFYRAELGAVDAKFIGKKLVLKGDIQLVTLYRGGEGLVPLRFELPYSQILDLGETTEEAEPEVVMTLKSVDCHLREGELEVTLEALGFRSVTQAACSSLMVVQANSASNRTSSPLVTGTAVASPTGRQVHVQVQPGGSSPRQATGMSTSTPHSASSSLR